MSKPKAIPVPEAQEPRRQRKDNDHGGNQEPNTGSHRAKIAKQSGHFNPEG
ncbi:small acid-soluble spore protein P [Paenibacillus sp. F411]|uniref:Small acid-soluble spore P family protein n=1 Tax=Paenibacillus algicola TaxID=2565926 RepID=A0A4P8XES6_9BACL|nr:MULTISPECIES: small acid-soluble spore protein P [Paenibacillus]MBO2946047.1 small acid-soluble spore protein P [Paenibacillus sp. F411]QCT00816.1 small acid-soluble spore P family protein [Paenibacillus algicola]